MRSEFTSGVSTEYEIIERSDISSTQYDGHSDEQSEERANMNVVNMRSDYVNEVNNERSKYRVRDNRAQRYIEYTVR
jgi:hypothetical protein